MNRRRLLRLAGGTLAFASAGSMAQSAKAVRIGVLYIGPVDADTYKNGLREGLRDLGHVEGRDIAYEYRSADEKPERLPALAAELVRLKVDVIVALYVQSALAAKAATREIPIVVIASSPVETGIVPNLAAPGGNITGVSMMTGSVAKNLDLFRDLVPSLRRVAVLGHAGQPVYAKAIAEEVQQACAASGFEAPSVAMVRGASELEGAFKAFTAERAQALVVQGSLANKAVADLAIRHRLPTASTARSFVDAGGLMSFGAGPSTFRLAANFVHRILQGRKPAELPMEQPTQFELAINMGTARAIGLAVPDKLLLRADVVLR